MLTQGTDLLFLPLKLSPLTKHSSKHSLPALTDLASQFYNSQSSIFPVNEGEKLQGVGWEYPLTAELALPCPGLSCPSVAWIPQVHCCGRDIASPAAYGSFPNRCAGLSTLIKIYRVKELLLLHVFVIFIENMSFCTPSFVFCLDFFNPVSQGSMEIQLLTSALF